MKHISIGFLLLALILGAAIQPASVFARGGSDDDSQNESSYDDDDDDSDDDSNDDDSDDDSNDDDSTSDDGLEVEADVFTDITIVKVELAGGAKTSFSTDADTEEEVAAVVADKFDLTEEEVLAVLDFEIEDRASRAGERINLKDRVKDRIKDRIKDCQDDSSSMLEVEADVFTDITIVKVELASGTKKVFDTEATTSADIIAEVAERYNLDADDVEAVLDLEIEDRASRAADRVIASNSADCDDDNSNVGGNNGTSTASRDAELRARISELQRLLETLIRLFTARFGTSI
jgi:hypothetical protein